MGAIFQVIQFYGSQIEQIKQTKSNTEYLAPIQRHRSEKVNNLMFKNKR